MLVKYDFFDEFKEYDLEKLKNKDVINKRLKKIDPFKIYSSIEIKEYFYYYTDKPLEIIDFLLAKNILIEEKKGYILSDNKNLF